MNAIISDSGKIININDFQDLDEASQKLFDSYIQALISNSDKKTFYLLWSNLKAIAQEEK